MYNLSYYYYNNKCIIFITLTFTYLFIYLRVRLDSKNLRTAIFGLEVLKNNTIYILQSEFFKTRGNMRVKYVRKHKP